MESFFHPTEGHRANQGAGQPGFFTRLALRRLEARHFAGLFALTFLAPMACGETAAPVRVVADVVIPGSKEKYDFLEVDQSHHRLLGAHEHDKTVDFIDLNTEQLITRLKFDGTPVDVIYYPKADRYYVSGNDARKVFIVDASTLRQTGEIATEGDLDALMYEPNRNRIYAGNDEGRFLWVIDPDANKVEATIDVPGVPESMVYDASADRLYLNIKSKNVLAVIDLNAGKVVDTWPTAPAALPHGLVLDSASHRLFSAGQNGQLVAIDTRTGKVVAAVRVPETADQAAFDPSTRRIYCACVGKLAVVQETDSGLEYIGDIGTAPLAKDAAVDLQTHMVWQTFSDGADAHARGYRQQ